MDSADFTTIVTDKPAFFRSNLKKNNKIQVKLINKKGYEILQHSLLQSSVHYTGYIKGRKFIDFAVRVTSDENFPEKFKSENFPFFYKDS
jgi:hypothetical protein